MHHHRRALLDPLRSRPVSQQIAAERTGDQRGTDHGTAESYRPVPPGSIPGRHVPEKAATTPQTPCRNHLCPGGCAPIFPRVVEFKDWNMSLTKSEIVSAIAQQAGVEKKTAEAMIDALARLAYEHARDEFSVPGIGKLVVVERKARTARNPKTGATIQVPAKKALKFR